eukprot:1157995-Pelagomonas_calceolata.AAC.2
MPSHLTPSLPCPKTQRPTSSQQGVCHQGSCTSFNHTCTPLRSYPWPAHLNPRAHPIHLGIPSNITCAP